MSGISAPQTINFFREKMESSFAYTSVIEVVYIEYVRLCVCVLYLV